MAKGKPYDVGYGKPPKSGQFKKGQSGNPKGRPKPKLTMAQLLLEELEKTVMVTMGGKTRSVALQRLIVHRMVADAVKGNAKARDQLLKLLGPVEAARAAETISTSADDDAEILARYRARLLEEIKK